MNKQKVSDAERKSDTRGQYSLEKDDTLNHRISPINLLPFCNQLEIFIKYIRSIKDLNYLTYIYPNDLQNRLDTNVHELQSILAEVKDALVNIEQLKMQRNLIKKEKITVKRTLKRMRDNEVRDMECIVSLYDKTMFSRWENAKTTHKPDVLEGMLSDIKGKQLALENLNTLIMRKLNQLQVFSPLLESDAEKFFGKKQRTVIPLTLSSLGTVPNDDPPKIPPTPQPPPISSLPLPLTSHLSKRSHAQRLSIQRRRRREDNLERRCTITTNVDDLPLVPLTLNDIPHNLISNLYPTITNTNSSSNHDVISANSTSSTLIRNGLNGIPPTNNNSNGSYSRLGTEFQSEMRTVLQALFGDLRTGPTLLVTDSSSNDTTIENTGSTNNNREIELHTLRKPQ